MIYTIVPRADGRFDVFGQEPGQKPERQNDFATRDDAALWVRGEQILDNKLGNGSDR